MIGKGSDSKFKMVLLLSQIAHFDNKKHSIRYHKIVISGKYHNFFRIYTKDKKLLKQKFNNLKCKNSKICTYSIKNTKKY